MEILRLNFREASLREIIKERHKRYETFLALNGIIKTGSMRESLLKEITFLDEQIKVLDKQSEYSKCEV